MPPQSSFDLLCPFFVSLAFRPARRGLWGTARFQKAFQPDDYIKGFLEGYAFSRLPHSPHSAGWRATVLCFGALARTTALGIVLHLHVRTRRFHAISTDFDAESPISTEAESPRPCHDLTASSQCLNIESHEYGITSQCLNIESHDCRHRKRIFRPPPRRQRRRRPGRPAAAGESGREIGRAHV